MKRLTCLIALGTLLTLKCTKSELINPSLSQGEWQQVRTSQREGHYHALCFADERNGWAVGDSGRVLHTTDGGSSWNVQQSGTTAGLTCVCFPGSQGGWIGGEANTIGITTNGGSSWTWQHPAGESRRTFMGISFINEQEGWVVDNYSGILHTNDGGSSWTPQSSGTPWAVTSVQFVNPQEGWATATNRVVLHTMDGGNNWTVTTLDTLDYGRYVTVVYSDIFSYHSRAWIATNAMASSILNPRASVVYTPDAGKTWTCQSTPEIMGITSIRFVDENVGWAASSLGILHTIDGGQTWNYEFQQEDALFVDIFFVNTSHGSAITFGGEIYRYQAP